MDVLFVVPYPIEAPSTRYRVYQYLPYLQANGINPTVSRFIASSAFFQRLYQPGAVAYKAAYFLGQTLRRLLDLTRVRRFDAVFIQREALPVGPALFELITAKLGCPVIYDFDDAIYLPRSSAANRWVSWLKQPGKTADIVRHSTQVIVGNRILQEYARQYNRAVTIIPSSIDPTVYTLRPNAPAAATPVTIGWVGSGTNLTYVADLAPVLRTIGEQSAIQVQIVGGFVALPGVNAICRPWRLENEIADLHSFDIGIMPLSDDPWTRGKGGFKAIQYMGVGLPVVASPVGINTEIIIEGVSGFLAETAEEWQRALSTLVRDAALRRRFGCAGRATVEAAYSTTVNAPKLLQVIQSV
jgi:glycosyltransferase involved in cell wall biosynthesis